MFRSARIKLTGWYLLIIMLISFFFSAVIYVGMARELEIGFRRAELRLKAEEYGIPLPQRFSTRPEDLPPRLREMSPRFLSVEDLEMTKKRLGLNLLVVNGVILGISALVGYFLAGKTLTPIEVALEEQKRFVADASHELRTPLTALKTSIEVALRKKRLVDKDSRAMMESSLEDIDSLESLANNLLSLTQYQQGNSNFIFQPTDINEVVESAHKKISPLAKKKNIKINLRISSQVLEANRQSLTEMMLIFFDNAVKYTPKGGKVVVTTRLGGKSLIVRVKDTGIGISKEDIPHIFDRFYRVDQSRSKDIVAGVGLGLSLAKRIIELHKGSVEVESVEDKGTTFTVKLPLKHS